MCPLIILKCSQTSSLHLYFSPPSQDEALQLCIKISTAIDRVEYMFTTEFEAEVEESESATLHQYYREAMIQGYNFAFEVTERCWKMKATKFTSQTHTYLFLNDSITRRWCA